MANGINGYLEKHGLPEDRRQAAFLHPDGNSVTVLMRKIEVMAVLDEPLRLDLAVLSIGLTADDVLQTLDGVAVTDRFSAEPGDPIAMLGYPGGTELLRWRPPTGRPCTVSLSPLPVKRLGAAEGQLPTSRPVVQS